ncbi:MFS transporter [Herbihabitans rhizosphaerae]|nr:MFS transporter [Herbihabitans rhizosphaerae]
MNQPASRWPAVAAFMAVVAATQVAWVMLAPVTTVAAEHYRVSTDDIGWSAQAFPLLYVVLAIPAGIVLDRWFRGGLAAGALLTAIGSVLRLIGDDYTWVLCGQIVIAVAQPLVLNAITGLAVNYLSERDRPLGIALGSASNYGGMVIAFGLGAVLSTSADLRTLIWIGTIISLVSCVALLVALRRPGGYAREEATAGLSGVVDAVRHAFVPPLLALVALGFGVSIALMTWLQALVEPAGVSAGAASVILLAFVVAGAIGSCVIAPVVARRGVQVRFFLVAVAAATVSCLVMAIAPGTMTGVITMAVTGAALLTALPVVLEIVERRLTKEANTAAGLVWMAGNVGGFAVAAVTGGLIGSPSLAFVMLAVVAALGAPSVALLTIKLRQRTTTPA